MFGNLRDLKEMLYKRVSAEQNTRTNPSQIPLDEIFQTRWERLCSLGSDVMKLWSGTLIPGEMTDSYFVLFICYSKGTAVSVRKEGRISGSVHALSLLACSPERRSRKGKKKEKNM